MNDGVVKYRVEHTKTGSIDETLFASLQPLRRRLKELGLIGVKEGVGYGNISRRLSDGNFVITATQTGHLPRLDGDGYALITDYDEDSFCIKSKGAAKPSSEAFTHAAVYSLSPKIQYIAHIHSKPIWSMMLKGNYLKTEPVPYGTKEMAKEVKRIYENIYPLEKPLFAMAGHEDGVMLFGEKIDEILSKTDRLLKEINCFH